MIDEPIVVTGGSVTITFNKDKFPGEHGRHSASDGRIVSVDVVDENTGSKQTIAAPENGKCTITIHTTY
jgi:hypothetical protein